MRFIIYAVLIGLTCSTISQAAVQGQSNPVGIWKGKAYQANPAGPGMSYDISLRINETGNGIIQYPSLSCIGTLIRQPGDVIQYREQLTLGKERCVDNGKVVLEKRGDQLFWQWSGQGTRAPNTTATAMLSQVVPQRQLPPVTSVPKGIDPFAYCRDKRNTAEIEDDNPAKIIVDALKAAGGGAAGGWWRCKDGQVYGCYPGGKVERAGVGRPA